MSTTKPQTDPTRLLTHVVLAALVLIGVAVLARRFWPASARTQMGGLKQLALPLHQVDPADWREAARAELQQALQARERRQEEERRMLDSLGEEGRQRVLA